MTHTLVPPSTELIQESVELALKEDIGSGDVTAGLIPKEQLGIATIKTREAGVLSGQAWVDSVFQSLSSDISLEWFKQDGDDIDANDILCQIKGPLGLILTGERTAMNFLQMLSGTASLTSKYVKAMGKTNCRLLDTRKTIPGHRLAQKYAVRCGGGENHRLGLYDAYLVKENHLQACGGIDVTCQRLRRCRDDLPVEVEVETIRELESVLKYGINIIMLDNFTVSDIKHAVMIRDEVAKAEGHVTQLEVSGNVSLDNIGTYAATGVDMISVGALTKDIHALDLSLSITQVS